MKFLTPKKCLRACLAIAAAVTLAGAIAAPVWAGGSSFGDDDEEADEGPAYFGFVRDTGGNSISDAKVTVGIKNRGGVVTRSDALGTYRVPGFGKDVDTKEVEVSCEKEGYKQVKTFRRTAPTALNVPIIETECTLQKG
ncbi:MAG TPA: carboxypeptidase-like regulatory domain-containing protein [Xanthobacteraceae bacterium]